MELLSAIAIFQSTDVEIGAKYRKCSWRMTEWRSIPLERVMRRRSSFVHFAGHAEAGVAARHPSVTVWELFVY